MEDVPSILAVQMTGRISALLFAAALLVPPISRHRDRRAADLFAAFIVAQTVHFAAVSWFAISNDGRNLFPNGMSLQTAGGWPTVVGIYLLFYGLAFIGLTARQAGTAAGHRLRRADTIATVVIGLMFLSAYVPLLTASLWFAVPAALVLAGLIVYALEESVLRLWSCRAP